MLRTNVYLTEEQERAINVRALASKQPKAAVLRSLIDQGLKASLSQPFPSTQAFFKLGKIAEQFKGKVTGPKDLSSNIDKYLWEEK